MSLGAAKIANYFLDLAKNEGMSITTLKLIKLIYIAHGWCLATLDKDILNGEPVQAWQHGPVVPSLYHEFKSFGKRPITSKATEIEFVSLDDDIDDFDFAIVEPELDNKDDNLLFVLKFVWDVYKQYSAFDLVNMTHKPNTPWSKSYKAGEKSVVIDNELIKEYYTRQVSGLVEKDY